MAEELFEEGLLKRINPSDKIANKSFEKAEKNLEEALKIFEIKLFEVTISRSYKAVFHALRTLLFKEGIKEYSHYALIKYIKEKYANELGTSIINQLDSYRIIRHKIEYGFDSKATEEEAEDAIEFAREILEKTREIINK
ncbi:MAG: HEPN domain-containing protein [Candidatus Diapherotrites archaeon]